MVQSDDSAKTTPRLAGPSVHLAQRDDASGWCYTQPRLSPRMSGVVQTYVLRS